MSRRYHRRALLGLAGAAGLAFTLGPRTLRAQAGETPCRVLQLVGQAWRDSAGVESPLALGDGLALGDRVATGAASKLQVLFVDGSSLILGPDSTCGIAVYDPEPETAAVLLLLLVGTLRVTVGEGARWRSFEVQGGTAVASVRATEWAMEETPKGSAVLCLEGAVQVRSRLSAGTPPDPAASEGVTLQPGEGTDVPPNGPPTPPKTWGEARRDKLLALVTLP
jgi:hypothetical protein